MADKLNWEYQDAEGEYYAYHNGHRIRAVPDSDPSNPFEDGDYNWPIIVRDPDNSRSGRLTTYEFGKREQGRVKADLSFFERSQLVHDQHAILKALGWPAISEPPTLAMERAFETYMTEDPVGYCTDPDVLQDLFEQVLDDNADSEKLEQLMELYKLAGIRAICTTVRGHSQGDWAEVLVIATPEAQDKFGARNVTDEDLEATAELYGHWAYGDVWGFIVEAAEDPEDPAVECQDCDWTGNESELDEIKDIHQRVMPGETMPAGECPACGALAHLADEQEPNYVEVEHGSCWGYYGHDFAKSGLEEAALECVPDEEKVDG